MKMDANSDAKVVDARSYVKESTEKIEKVEMGQSVTYIPCDRRRLEEDVRSI